MTTKQRKFRNGGHAPTRYFGTWLGFTADGPGLWRAFFKGETYTIERRRAEQGCPAGWYYFGPGARDGQYAGSVAEQAAELAIEQAP